MEISAHLGVRTTFLAKAHYQQWELAAIFYTNALNRTKRSLETVTKQQTRFQAARGSLETALGELAATPVTLGRAHDLREFVDESPVEELNGEDWNGAHEQAISNFRHLLPQIQQQGEVFHKARLQKGMSSSEIQACTKDTVECDFEGESSDQRVKAEEEMSRLLADAENGSESMAGLLQSLACHYDLCERGADLEAGMESEDPNELEEISHVLEEDSKQVPSVIEELGERLGEIRECCRGVELRMQQMYGYYQREMRQLQRIQAVEATMDKTLALCEKQQKETSVYLGRIQLYVSEASSLVSHYRAFRKSYDALLVEAERRREADARAALYTAEINAKLAQMSREETQKRQEFLIGQGDYLPADIWDGLLEPAKNYEVRELD